MFHVEPREGNAKEIHRFLRENIKTYYVKLLENIESELTNAGYEISLDSARERAENLDLSRSFAPGLYVHHSQLVGAMNQNNTGTVLHEVGRFLGLSEDEIYRQEKSVSIESAHTDWWEDYALSGARNSPPGLSVAFPIGDDRLDMYRSDIDRALSLIKDVDPIIHEEIEEYVDSVKLFTGENLIGASSANFYGNIYLQRPEDDFDRDERVAYFIEHIVHEASHHHATALEIHDEMVLNPPEERFDAPIRPDPRPMSGIYHATFVLTRISRVFRRLYEETGIEVFEEYRDRTETEWKHGYKDVVNHGNLTPRGEQICEEFEEVLRE